MILGFLGEEKIWDTKETRMTMVQIFYYYYYLFYSKILGDNEPHLLTTLVLSFSQSLIIVGFLDVTLASLFCKSLGKWEMIAVTVLMVGINYLFYHRTGKAREIIKRKPKFLGSHWLSVIVTLLFFIGTTSYLFWGSFYVRDILGHCK